MCEKVLGNCQQLLHLGLQVELLLKGEGGQEYTNTGPGVQIFNRYVNPDTLQGAGYQF